MSEFFDKDHLLAMSMQLAQKHADILERECKNICHKFSIASDKLIIKYYTAHKIDIDIKGISLEINDEFIFNKQDNHATE